ncbi:gas vesicle protein GvpJ [Streptomyces sp. NPDC049555]|uniref:gas vesicle protein GvpJ n=1 Tax=unclassified Streptomyces TaxID=2593676 RepID=UPI00342EE67C
MSVVPAPQGGGGAGGTSGLYDVLELVLDRGLVIDAFVRVSLVGIEILKIDVRVVVASVDTYLRFAEACNRLDLEAGPHRSAGLPDLVGNVTEGVTEGGARGKTKGAISGAAQSIADAVQQVRGDSQGSRRSTSRKKEESE